ncbi:MAG TPA: hypothetical protein VLB68_28870 [Pyrinomonadaceae bacterium]|nr:hypothetical protein [Pyrinomonadaceae bacterium]
MNTKFLTPVLAAILALTTAPICTAQTTTAPQVVSDWQGVRTLKRGKQILIEYKSNVGGTLECKFVSLAGAKLIVSAGGYQATIEQADIQRIYRLNGNWSRGKMAKVGAGIGMLVGSFVGAARGLELERQPGHVGSDKDTFPALAGFVIGTAAGAGLGALIGGKRKGNLLYEAR